jgi:16S rRNA G527 N7-methylase RsmG
MTYLQEIINDRADAKLNKDIKELDTMLSRTFAPLINNLNITIHSPLGHNIKCTLNYALYDDERRKILFELNKDRYREAETKLFAAKVESLTKNVESLKDNIDNLLNNM